MSFPIDYCGEGPIDSTVARRLIVACGGVPGIDYVARSAPRGKDALDRRLGGLVAGARTGRLVLVLRDLDTEVCPGALLLRLVPHIPPTFSLRIAVRAVEAWLLADPKGIARALQIDEAHIPRQPEALPNPKAALRDLASRSSNPRSRHLAASTPQAFGALTADIAAEHWDPARAERRSPSLARAMHRVRALCDG